MAKNNGQSSDDKVPGQEVIGMEGAVQYVDASWERNERPSFQADYDKKSRSWNIDYKGKPNRKFNEKAMAIFLTQLARTSRWAQSARASGVTYTTVRRRRESDEGFADLCEEALELYKDYVQEAVEEQGIVGVFQPIVDKDGKIVGWKRVLSPQVLLAEARRVNPEYREKGELDVSVTHGGTLVVEGQLSDEKWEELYGRPAEPARLALVEK